MDLATALLDVENQLKRMQQQNTTYLNIGTLPELELDKL